MATEGDVRRIALCVEVLHAPHHDGYPNVLVQPDAVDVEDLTELITDSWLVKAPANVRKGHPEVGRPAGPRSTGVTAAGP